MVDQRTCKRCGTTYYDDEVQAVFRKGKKGDEYTHHPTYSAVCQACEVTARTQAKEVNRFATKARNTIKHHGKKLGLTPAEMADRFLWTVDRIAHDMEHAWQNGCNDCGDLFQKMPNGLHDLTVDIREPSDPPHWGSNTRFVCTTCNRKKSRTPAKLWGAMRAAWARWRKRQEELAKLPKWWQEKLWNEE